MRLALVAHTQKKRERSAPHTCEVGLQMPAAALARLASGEAIGVAAATAVDEAVTLAGEGVEVELIAIVLTVAAAHALSTGMMILLRLRRNGNARLLRRFIGGLPLLRYEGRR